jgi:hypothetical protein
MSMIAHMNTGRWAGVVLGVVVTVMVHLTAGPNADDPWPTLLTSDPVNRDPGFALLQERANGSLDKLLQSAGTLGVRL